MRSGVDPHLGAFTPPLTPTGWPVYRIVPSRFPPVSLFDRIVDAADLESVFAIEALTNDRLRDEVGEISLVPVEDRVTGPGSTPIMAAFTHLHEEGARFNDSTFSAYYAARDLDTAVAETKYHRERFLAYTNEARIDIDMRAYVARLNCELHDLRTGAPPALYDPESYRISQKFGRSLREQGSNGVIYRSVRAVDGTCVAIFRPRCLSDCRQERHLTYCWDGSRISQVYEKREYSP